MHSISMGAEHLGVRIQAPIQIQATPILRDCSYCFERRDAIQVSERRSASSFRKIGDNTPALGSDRTGFLFNLFPDSEERWGSSAHPESQEVQSSFKASALPYALSFNPFNVHQTRGLVHNSGSPGCLFPHPNSQGPQKVSPILLSGQRLRVQCSPLRSVIGSPHLHQMYECGTHSSSSPGPTYCQLPGRLGNLLAYRAAGQEQHKGGPSPLAEIRVDSEQQKELSHSHKGGDVPRLEFGYNESIPDSTEAVSVEGVPVRVPQKGSRYSEAGSETAWPNGGSLSGGAIGVASHAPITAMVNKVSPYENGQRLVPRDLDCLPGVKWWLSTPGLKEGVRLGPLCSRETITTDASQAGWGAVWRGNTVQGKWEASWIGEHINLLELEAVFRALTHFIPQFQEKRVVVRSDSTTVVSYINHQGGVRSISLHRKARDLLLWAHAQGVSLRAVHLPGEDNVAADLLSRGGPRPGEWRLHPALIQATWLRFGKDKVDIFATQENTHCPLWYSMVGPRGPLGVDALANKWPPVLLYAFTPFPLLPAVLAKVRMLKAKVLLVAPDWPQQSWMPDLIALLRGSPWRLPVRQDMLSQAQGQISLPNSGKYRLHGSGYCLEGSDRTTF